YCGPTVDAGGSVEPADSLASSAAADWLELSVLQNCAAFGALEFELAAVPSVRYSLVFPAFTAAANIVRSTPAPVTTRGANTCANAVAEVVPSSVGDRRQTPWSKAEA